MQSGKLIVEGVGWYGLFAILMAYALVSFGTITPNSITYQLLNLTGSITLVILTFYKKAYQNVILNVIWSGISLIAILQIILSSR